MRWLALLVVSLLTLVVTSDHEAEARRRFAGAGVPACITHSETLASGTTVDDGLCNAPSYINSTLSYLNASALNDGTVFQSGQNAAEARSKITWHLPGVGYAVGVRYRGPYVTNGIVGAYCKGDGDPNYPCSHTPGARGLIDAYAYFNSTLTNFKSQVLGDLGCASNVTNTLNKVTCSPGTGTAVKFVGLDFAPLDADGTTHHCIAAVVSGGTGGNSTLAVTDSRIATQYIDGCEGFNSSGSLYQFQGSLGSGQNWDVTISYNWMDGGAANTWPVRSYMFNINGPTTSNTTTITAQYNYVQNVPAKWITGAGCPISTEFDYNVLHNETYDVGNPFVAVVHAEHVIFGPGTGCNATVAAKNYAVNNLGWQDAGLPDAQAVYFLDLPNQTQAVGTSVVTDGRVALNLLASNFAQNPNSPVDATRGPGTLRTALSLLGAYNPVIGTACDSVHGGCTYQVGDIVQMNTAISPMPASCNATPTVAPSFIVLTVSSGTPTSVVQWKGGLCGSPVSIPSNLTGQATTCIGHANYSTGNIDACSSGGSGLTISVQFEAPWTMTTGNIALSAGRAASVDFNQTYTKLDVSKNVLSISGNKAGNAFYIGNAVSSGFNVICTNGAGTAPTGTAVNRDNWILDIAGGTGSNYVGTTGAGAWDPNCFTNP